MDFSFLEKLPIDGLAAMSFGLSVLFFSMNDAFGKNVIRVAAENTTRNVGGLIQFIIGFIKMLAGGTYSASMFLIFAAFWMVGSDSDITSPAHCGMLFLAIFVLGKFIINILQKGSILFTIMLGLVFVFCVLLFATGYETTNGNLKQATFCIGFIIGILGVVIGAIEIFNSYVGKDVIPTCVPKK